MEPLTPIATETMIRRLMNDLSAAYLAFARAKDEAVSAAHEYKSARREVRFSPDTPVAKRGELTVAHVEEWIDERVANLAEKADLAAAKADAAQEHLRNLRAQLSGAQSLNASVQSAYSAVGRTT